MLHDFVCAFLLILEEQYEVGPPVNGVYNIIWRIDGSQECTSGHKRRWRRRDYVVDSTGLGLSPGMWAKWSWNWEWCAGRFGSRRSERSRHYERVDIRGLHWTEAIATTSRRCTKIHVLAARYNTRSAPAPPAFTQGDTHIPVHHPTKHASMPLPPHPTPRRSHLTQGRHTTTRPPTAAQTWARRTRPPARRPRRCSS